MSGTMIPTVCQIVVGPSDPITFFLNSLKKSTYIFTSTVFHTAAVCAWLCSNSRNNYDHVTAMERHARKLLFQNMRSAEYHENMIGRTYVGGDHVTQLHLVVFNAITWPYYPKHSPSYYWYGRLV